MLTALTGLRSLAVVRCPRIGDKGLLIVQRLSHLTALNCYGCIKVPPAPPRWLPACLTTGACRPLLQSVCRLSALCLVCLLSPWLPRCTAHGNLG